MIWLAWFVAATIFSVVVIYTVLVLQNRLDQNYARRCGPEMHPDWMRRGTTSTIYRSRNAAKG